MIFLMQFSQTPSRQELLRNMSRGFNKTASESASTWWGLFWVFVGIGALALLLFAISSFQTRERRPLPNNAAKLFTELAKQLGLTRAEQRVLRSVASQTELEPSALLFVSPEIFDGAAKRWARAARRPRGMTR